MDAGGMKDDIPDELLGMLDLISPNEVEFDKLIGKKIPKEDHDMRDREVKVLIEKFPNLSVLLKLGD